MFQPSLGWFPNVNFLEDRLGHSIRLLRIYSVIILLIGLKFQYLCVLIGHFLFICEMPWRVMSHSPRIISSIVMRYFLKL